MTCLSARRAALCGVFAAIVLQLASCADAVAPDAIEPAGLILVSGDQQTAQVGEELAGSLVVRVVDAQYRPVPGATVHFEVVGGGALSRATAMTLGNGTADTRWTLGKRVADAQRVRARLPGGVTAGTISFAAVAKPGPATSILVLAGNDQQRPPAVALRDSIAAQVQDAYGNPVAGVAVQWRVTAGAGAISPVTSMTDTEGVARASWTLGPALGLHAAEASIAAQNAIASFTARGVPRPVITRISPDTLVPGGVATIVGTNFGPSDEITVAFNGSASVIEYADSSRLQVEVPCEPSGPIALTLNANGASVRSSHTMAVPEPLSLSVGQAEMLNAGTVCRELSGGGRYLLAVANGAGGTGTTAFLLRGGTSDDPPRAAAVHSAHAPAGRGRAPRVPLAALRRGEAHARVLEESYRLVERLGAPARDRALQAEQPVLPTGSAAQLAVDDTITMKIPNAAGDLCTIRAQIRARVVFAGNRAIIMEDVASPLAGRMDSVLRAMGEEFENLQWGIITQYFGNPLAYDGQTDRNGRIYMVFSKVVNDFENFAAFTSSGDLYPASACAASNSAEVLYGTVPTDDAGGYGDDTRNNPENWQRAMRALLIHEAKHITAFAEKFARNGPSSPDLEERWLEEGTAVIAEELFARAVFGYGQHSNTTYQQSLFCEARPDPARHPPQCWHKPVIMYGYFALLSEYLAAPESLSPLGPAPASSDITFYGSAWWLLRWAADNVADESAFFRALIQERTLKGIANLEARTGRNFAELLADWILASALDDRPDVSTQRVHSIPSWNSRDIHARMHENSPAEFPNVFPLAPRLLPSGSFAMTLESLRAGSAALFEFAASPSGPQLLNLTDPSGAAPPDSNLRLKLIRIE